MKRQALERWVRAHDAERMRHGANHDVWLGPSGRPTPMPRHREIDPRLAREICDQLGVPRPAGS